MRLRPKKPKPCYRTAYNLLAIFARGAGRFAEAECSQRILEALVPPEYVPASGAELPDICSKTCDDALFIWNLCFAKPVNVGRAGFLLRFRSAIAVILLIRKCVRTAKTERAHKYD
jgi:hypothetical protein